jgi:hypothetical protein
MASSTSSGSMGSISSSLSLDESEPSMFTLPSELDTTLRSDVPGKVVQGVNWGGSNAMELMDIFRLGIIIPFCVTVGDESGEDCSASVEWCRFVQALEKSRPRE